MDVYMLLGAVTTLWNFRFLSSDPHACTGNHLCNLHIRSFSCHNGQAYDRYKILPHSVCLPLGGVSICEAGWLILVLGIEGLASCFPLVRHLNRCLLIWVWMRSAWLGLYLYRSLWQMQWQIVHNHSSGTVAEQAWLWQRSRNVQVILCRFAPSKGSWIGSLVLA